MEDYGQHQSQLFQVLERYHLVPDTIDNLKSQFDFLKEATSRNVQNLQQAIAVQQSYTTNFCTYINSILNQLTNIEEHIQQLNQVPNTEQDTVQLNAPEFDPDIDEPAGYHHQGNNTAMVSVQGLLNSPQPSTTNAAQPPQESTLQDQGNIEGQPFQVSYRGDSIPNQITHCPTTLYLTEQDQRTATPNLQPDEIPELE